MAGPITWRNINAPDFTGSAAMLESGSQALQGGLDKLMQLGKDYQARQENAWEKGTERNNNAIIQDLLSAKTVEEYDGIMGGLKERMAAMGGQVDATDIMQRAIQGRTDLQNRTKTDAEFATFQLGEQWKPVTSQVEALIAANQHDKAAEVLRTSGIPEQLQSALWRSLEQDQQSDQTFDVGMRQKQLGMAQTRQQMDQAATEHGWKVAEQKRLSQERLVSDYAAGRALAGKPMDEGLSDFFNFVGGLESVSPTAITNGLNNMVNTYSSLVGDNSPFAQKENEAFTREFTETPVKDLGIFVPNNGYFKESDSYVTALQKIQKGKAVEEAKLAGLPEWAKPGGVSTSKTLDRVALELGGRELPSDISGQEGWIANFISSQSPGMRVAPEDANKLRNKLIDATEGKVSNFGELPYELVEEFLVKIGTNARTTDNELKIDEDVIDMAARQVFGNFKFLTDRGKAIATEVDRLNTIERGFQKHQVDSTRQFKEKRERERLRELVRSRNQ